jgi:hypothetical protein
VCTLEEQATRKVEQERHAQAAAAVDVVAQAARIREVLAGRNAVQ